MQIKVKNMVYGNWVHSYTGRHNWTKAVEMIKEQGASKVNLKVKVVPTGSFGTKAVTSGTFTLKACDEAGDDYATGSVDSRDIPEIKPGDVFEFTVDNVEVDKLHRISFDRPALAGDTKFDFNAFVMAFPAVETAGSGPLASWTVTRYSYNWESVRSSSDYQDVKNQIIQWCNDHKDNVYHVVLEMTPYGGEICYGDDRYGAYVYLGDSSPAINLSKMYTVIDPQNIERRIEGDFQLSIGGGSKWDVYFMPPCNDEGYSGDVMFTLSFYEA